MRGTIEKLALATIDLGAEAKTSSTGKSPLGSRMFVGFILVVLLYLSSIYLVDPAREFGVATNFPAVHSDHRGEKVALFTSFAQEGPIDGLILGSNRSMLLNAARMSQLAEGQRFFNFGFNGAQAEDFLATLRFVRVRGHLPKRIIIGVDVESLRDTEKHSLHPLREYAVGKPGLFSKVRAITGRLLSVPYALDTAQSVYLRLQRRKPALVFLSDGTVQYRSREEQRFEGTFRLEAELTGCIQASRAAIENTVEPSAEQVRYLRQTVQEARAQGSQVTLWLTGPHPRTAEHMASGTAYPHLVAQTWGLLRQEASDALNLHDPAAYGGPPNGWYDCNHFDNSHAMLIERILIGGRNTHNSTEDPVPEPRDEDTRRPFYQIAEGFHE